MPTNETAAVDLMEAAAVVVDLDPELEIRSDHLDALYSHSRDRWIRPLARSPLPGRKPRSPGLRARLVAGDLVVWRDLGR